MSECRFCSKKLNEKEDHSTINEEIKECFTKITQIQLLETEECSKFICELCLRSLQLANALRIQLLKNEERLYDLIQKCEDFEEVTSFEPQFERTSQSVGTNERIHSSSNQHPDMMDYKMSQSSMKSYDSQFGYTTTTTQSYQNQHSSNHTASQNALNQILSNPSISCDEPPLLTKIPVGRLKAESEESEEIIQIKEEKSFEESGIIREEQLKQHTVESECQANFDSEPMGMFSMTQHFVNYSVSEVTVKKKTQGKNQSKTKKGKSLGTERLDIKPKYNSNATQTPYRSSEKIFYKNSSTKSFECLYCSFTTDSQHVIKTHMIQNHNTQIPTYKCPHCESTYFKGSNLKRHILVKHFNHRFECSVAGCNVQFRDGSSLKRHLSSSHPFLSKNEVEQIINRTKVNLPNPLEVQTPSFNTH